jgi:hypothetical protein
MIVHRGIVAIVLVAAVSSCAHVPAYERARLAHPTMRTGYTESPGVLHMRAVHEGATGGDVAASSGCGCN